MGTPNGGHHRTQLWRARRPSLKTPFQLILGARAEAFQQIGKRRALGLRESPHGPLHRVLVSGEHLPDERLAFRRQVHHPRAPVRGLVRPLPHPPPPPPTPSPRHPPPRH